MPALTYSTEGHAPHERFDYWRDAMCANFYGMTFDVERSKRNDFQGHLTARPIGNAGLVEMQASSCVIHRLEKEIQDAPGEALFLYRQRAGRAWIEAVDRRDTFVVEAGTIAIGDSDLPFNTAPMGADDYNCAILKIPMRCFDSIGERHIRFSAQGIDPSRGLGYLISTVFDACCREADNLSGPAADVAVQTLAQLLAVEMGMASPQSETTRDALRESKRRAVNGFIDANLHDPRLSPSFVAREMGMSIRQLHWLYEPTGTTFSQQVRVRRVERARTMIVRYPQRPIIDIVYACGFDSSATFYRAFRSVLGVSPGDLRRQSKT